MAGNSRPGGIGPLDPIYDVDTTYGAIAAGNTPGVALLRVTINVAAGQPDPTAISPILFDVVFTEDTVNFTTGDVTLTGTAGGTLVGTVSGSGSIYTVSVTGMTTPGTVIANILAGVCTATATGQPNVHSTSTDNIVGWVAFSPADLAGLWAWFDASDLSSIIETGGLADQINDKSGNGRHLTSTIQRPSTGSRTVNGLNVLDFQAAELMTRIGALGFPTDAYTIIFFGGSDTNPAAFKRFMSFWGAAATSDLNNVNSFAVSQGDATNDFYLFQNSNSLPRAGVGNTAIATWTVRKTTGVNGWQITDPAGGTVQTTEADSGIANGGFVLGAGFESSTPGGAGGLTDCIDGPIGEVCIYSGALSNSDRDLVRNYLISKWGA